MNPVDQMRHFMKIFLGNVIRDSCPKYRSDEKTLSCRCIVTAFYLSKQKISMSTLLQTYHHYKLFSKMQSHIDGGCKPQYVYSTQMYITLKNLPLLFSPQSAGKPDTISFILLCLTFLHARLQKTSCCY